MIRSMYYTQDGQLHTGLEVDQFCAAMQDPGGLLWVDFESTPPEQDEPILRETFGFHPLAIEDALQETHSPKLDDWGDYLYIVMHAASFQQHTGEDIETVELDIFLGRNYMVTHHEKPIDALNRAWNAVQRDSRHWRSGTDHLLYKVVDEVVTGYMPVVEIMDDEIDAAEDKIFDNPDPATLERIFTLKRAVLHLRRIIGPLREVINRLARDDYAMIDSHDRIFFRDVYDNLVRLYDITEGIRDLVTGALDTYLSVINNRMNDVMKTLTIITTLFMPLSFITGFFGMNFFASPNPLDLWVSKPVFFLMMILTFVTPFTMFMWIRRRGWM